MARLGLQFMSLLQCGTSQEEHCVPEACVSDARFDLGQDEPLCRVEAVYVFCLYEHPSRTLSAFGVKMPCQKLQLSMLAVWPTSSGLFSDFSAWMEISVS